jgi:hypothetical protein
MEKISRRELIVGGAATAALTVIPALPALAEPLIPHRNIYVRHTTVNPWGGTVSGYTLERLRAFNIPFGQTVKSIIMYHMFEFNDHLTRNNIRMMIKAKLAEHQAARQIYDYRVVCDEGNNYPSLVDGGGLAVSLYTKSVQTPIFWQIDAGVKGQ